MALEISPSSTRKNTDIAIIGMGCLFPDAADLVEYWQHIKQGHDAIRAIPVSHWRPEDYFNADPKTADHTYAKTGGFLKPYAFDPLKFGIAPQALEATDSTQLLGMVCAHEALVDAGYGPDNKSFDRDRVSCIIGVTGTLELVIPLGARLGHPIWKEALAKAGISAATTQQVMDDIASAYVPWQEASFPGLLGNVVAGRIANRLDLSGTNSVVDAACASSLAALHMAVMELQSGRADMVITGGMDTFNDIFMYMCFSKTPALSPTGSARPYDAEGDGTILGEGLGTVILKRVQDAERDGDRIYAILRGIGSSSDGKGQAIYAPSAQGQAKALERAYQQSEVSARSIELVEGHGTGTKVGDGVELEALTRVYRKADGQSRWCSLGSVKSQIGHTKAAAGAAGLIKAVLALHHKVLPPTIKVQKAHPKLLNSPFTIHNQARPWVSHPDHPRRAAVSAFGFGGSNYHAVLEEYAAEKTSIDWDPDLQIMAFSAETPAALFDSLHHAVSLLQQGMSPRELGRYSRSQFSAAAAHRLSFVVQNREQLESRLTALLQMDLNAAVPNWLYQGVGHTVGKLAFVFAGQGSQEPHMLRELVCQFPEFLETLDEGNQVLGQYEPHGPRLSDLIYPAQAFDEAEQKAQRQQLTETRYAQLALGTLGAAIIALLRKFGVIPRAVAGHSYGELLALYAAGALKSRDLLQLSYQRGRLMKDLGKPRGAMLAVMASEEAIQKVLADEQLAMEWANFNSDQQIVLGADEDLCVLAASVFKKAGIGTRRLEVSTAFHTSFVEPAVEAFQNELTDRPFESLNMAVYANTSSALYPDSAAEQKHLLGRQIASPVRFASMLRHMQKDGVTCFVEIGPQKKLHGLLKATVGQETCLSLDTDRTSSVMGLAQLLAQLASLAYPVTLSLWDEGPVSLSPPIKKNFTVEITGANYRQKQQSPARSAPPVSPSPAMTTAAASRPLATPKPSETIIAQSPTTRIPQEGNMSSSKDSWLRLEKIIQDMHEIQGKTADAHTLFLENQRQFQNLLQGMISGQPSAAMPLSVQKPAEAAPRQTRSQSTPSHSTVQAAPVPPASQPVAVPSPTGAAAASIPKPVAIEPLLTKGNAALVYEALAQSTGYPSELLKADMNLESDLGIDSIKKVEIFSQLQLRFPHLEADASSLGHLQSIADLLRLIEQPSAAEAAPARSGAWAASNVALAASSPTVDHQTILQVVAEKTGFPLAMLQADLELEADLGIDSIKKVEIFSVIQERLPQLGKLGPDELNGLRRIADLLAMLGSPEPAEALPLLGAINSAVMQGAEEKVWQVIADKTGYPREVLTAAMNLEADLGIDSIKRVEIFSVVSEGIPALQGLAPDKIAGLQTVSDLLLLARQAVDASEHKSELTLLEPDQDHDAWDLSKKKNPLEFEPAAASVQDPGLSLASLAAALDAQDAQLDEPTFVAKEKSDQDDYLRALQTSRLEVEAFQVMGAARKWLQGSEVWIGDDGSNLARNIMLKLEERGLQARLVSLAQADRLQVPQKLHGLIILAPLKLEVPPIRWLGQAFKLLRKCGPALCAQAELSTFAVVTRHGARFGLDGLQSSTQVYGSALAALAKTAHQEWPALHTRALDLGRDFTDGIEAALRCLDALLFQGPVELGVNRDQAFQLTLVPQKFVAEPSSQALVRSGDVILVTGGARGVTAASLLPLARQWRPHFVIWGRTPLVAVEADVYKGIDEAAALKRVILQSNPELTNPRDLEAAYRQLIQARELRANLQAIEANGARYTYETVDVSKDAELRLAFAKLQQEHGVPVGVIHGAGVIRDKMILDQKDEEFFEVLDTKLRILPFLEDLARQGLRWLLLYSSSTARLGRRGQVAYGVANETLNKFAQYLSSHYSDCYALAFNWGPWSGGMVNEGLKKIFAAEGVATISLEAGAALVQRSLEYPQPSCHEVIVLAEDKSKRVEPAIPQKRTEFSISLESVPILLDHVMKQRAVVPAALLLEWLAAAAQSIHPELHLQRALNFQVWKGIILDADQTLSAWVELQSESTDAEGLLEIEMHLLGLSADEKIVRHARVQLQYGPEPLLKPRDSRPPLAEDLLWQGLNPYKEILFHGESLQLIQAVQSCVREGLDARLHLQLAPADWSQQGVLAEWQISADAVDAVFQAAIIWSSLQEGRPCLPSRVGSFEVYQKMTPGVYQLQLRISRVENLRLIADADILNDQNQMVLRLSQLEMVMDSGLSQAFRQTHLSPVITSSKSDGI